jgi:heptosyltransferase-1
VQTRCGLKSAVLWGPGEETMAAQIARASAGAAEMAPATTLTDAIALAREARVVVSGDTGPTHLAAAVGTPIVGIYGPTDPARNGPWHPGDVCVSRFGVCACHHQRRCRQPERWCLAGIAVEEVLQAVQQRLTSQAVRADV